MRMPLLKGHDVDVYHGTTILSVRLGKTAAVGGDGQVTMNHTVMKHGAKKIRTLNDGQIIVGFSGAAADAFALLERFEGKLKDFQGNLIKSAYELAKDWRTDKRMRQLESLMIAIDKEHSLLLSGSGDVIEPDDGILAVGSGGQLAIAAARALAKHTDMSATEIVKEALLITSNLCIYTNDNITVEELK